MRALLNTQLLHCIKPESQGMQMAFTIRHGLVECTNYPGNKKSAIIFDDSFIITSACLLHPFLHEINSASAVPRQKAILEALRSHKPINAENETLQSLQIEITYDLHKMQSKGRQLLRFKAKILYIYTCREILGSAEDILNDLNEFHVNNEDTSDDRGLNKLTISTFIILQVVHPEKQALNFKKFITQMKNYLKFVDPINKLDDVLSISTPFGMESFYKTVNIGKISNVFGLDLCLFTISNNLVSGCEGAAVINSRLRLIGIIICTTFQWNRQNTNFTLVANFRHVLRSFLRQIGEIYPTSKIARNPTGPHWEKAIVLVRNRTSWGTGSFVKIHNSKYILTCSHVIKDPNEEIYCHYKDGKFEGTLVWQNPEYDQPYDIALINIPISIPGQYFSKLSKSTPYVGQSIYTAGFPITPKLGKESFRPSLYRGRIVKIEPGMIITDASVQAGQSGGPLFDSNGDLMGVSVSNSKDGDTKLIHPNINMSVPIFIIKNTLEKFAKTKDVAALNNLMAGYEVKDAWSLRGPRVNCKL